MNRFLMPALVSCALLLVGCATDDGPVGPDATPELDIYDGSHDGNALWGFGL